MSENEITPEEMQADFAAFKKESVSQERRADGVDCYTLDIHSVSYYPAKGEPENAMWLIRDSRGFYSPSNPLSHSDVDGDLTLCADPEGKLHAELAIRQINHRDSKGKVMLYPRDVSRSTGPSHPHTFTEIRPSPNGYYGHVYTVDQEGSSWSFHINKPFAHGGTTPFPEIEPLSDGTTPFLEE
ncbi:MAG: hypothetical protein HZC02_04910 [Candidatus Levybacteria bacterium]|nr:hypothetical protein [Candidatus Levybacteria bacterium]